MLRHPQPQVQEADDFETAIAANAQERYFLRLFVAGNTALSSRAIVNARKICETYLAGRYELEIVDAVTHPEEPARWQIIALPTLLKERPLPVRRFIGDLSEIDRVLQGLDVQRRPGDV